MTSGQNPEPRAQPADRGVDSIAHLNDPVGQAVALEHRRLHERHPCVVPDCGQRAETAFAVREYGSLAGRDWWPGDVIDMCAAHAADVYRAQEEDGVGKLAEWLRP